MEVLEASKMIFKATRLVYHSVVNKLNYVRTLAQTAPDGSLEQHRWKDLAIRSRWCTEYLGTRIEGAIDKGLSNLIAKNIYSISGEKISDTYPYRLKNPLSFSVEPCAMCKVLEKSFTPDDIDLRESGLSWTDRYQKMTQALITDAYKIMGSGYYYYDKVNEIRDTLTGNTPAGVSWAEVLQMWDIGIETSIRFLDTGKSCYSQTERITYSKVNNILDSRRESVGLELAHKYSTTDGRTLKCVGGLFAINRELVCSNCKPNIESDPITVAI